jgi:hypothetical protein
MNYPDQGDLTITIYLFIVKRLSGLLKLKFSAAPSLLHFKVRATTDRKRTAASRSASSPLEDIRQEILRRAEAYRASKNMKAEAGSSESRVEKEILIDLLIDMGQVGVALKTTVARLSGATVSELSSWIQARMENDSMFSGLSHFTDPSSDDILRSTGKAHSTTSSVKSKIESASCKTNNSRASSTHGRSFKGPITSVGSVPGGLSGISSPGSGGTLAKATDKLKATAQVAESRVDRRVDTQRGKKLQVITEDYSDEAEADSDAIGGTLLSPVVELSGSSSGYSSSSPALSDSEEEYQDRREDRDPGSDSGDEMKVNGPGGIKAKPHYVTTIYEEEEEYSSDENSPVMAPKPVFSPPHINTYALHPLAKSDTELAKIEEEEEAYSEEEEAVEEEGRPFSGSPHPTHSTAAVWRDWTDVLSAGTQDTVWLQRSLQLLSELCLSNSRAQKKAAHFLPPELLLHLLGSGKLSEENRCNSGQCTLLGICVSYIQGYNTVFCKTFI